MREPDPAAARSADLVSRACIRSTSATTTTAISTCRSQPESTNMNRVLYHEWFPQIMYNHHQTGPAGTVMFAPPFRDPFNYNFDPLIPSQLDLVGAAMHSRFAAEGKPGVTSRARLGLLDLVERRPADDGVLPQHDRAVDGDDRQSDADHDSVHPGTAAAGLEPALSDRTAGMALPAVGRLFSHRELRRLRHRFAEQGELPLQHLSDGQELDRARQPGQLDADAAPGHCRAGGSRRSGRAGGSRDAARWPRRRCGVQVAAARTGDARPARLHPARGPSRLSGRDRVHQCFDQGRRDGASRHRALQRRRQELPGEFLGREVGSGIPPARARHVRASGPPRRHSLSWWPPEPSV